MISRTRFMLSCAAGFLLAVAFRSEMLLGEEPSKPVRIDDGTALDKASTDSEKAPDFWSFRPVAKPALPSVVDPNWATTPIDHFVLARLESQELVPVEPANKRTWIRRVTFDFIGLPPAPAEVEAFIDDLSPSSHQKVVDRLLASPHYGERWARYWLDVARYAEEQHLSEANLSEALPDAYKYRDWVVTALNQDLPYDQFIIRQIAGDLVKSLGKEGWESVGFLALGPIYATDGGKEEAVFRAIYDTIDDKLDALSRGFLGLTTACARCHDHKFDPISIEDYYSLAGVFYNTRYVTYHWLVSPDIAAPYEQAQQRIQRQEKLIAKATDNGGSPTELKQLSAELEQLKKELPAMPASYPVHSLTDAGSEDVPIALRGNPVKKGPIVPRRFLRVLAGEAPPPFTEGSGRLELAHAIANKNNPLTARVMVNRLWQHHFGQGLVRTPSNFGALGEPPTHPELLDWLASRFTETGWSIKRLHRDMVLSATYRLGSKFHQRNFEVDGDNKLLWRMSPRRLDVEAWRDALLSVTGELDLAIGGPPVDDILTRSRRTLYAPIRRDSRFASDKFLRLFDFPNPWLSNSQRMVTTVPPQQLFMLNAGFMIERAKALAERLASLELPDPGSEQARIDRAYALLFSRPASPVEIDLGLKFLRSPDAEEDPRELTRWEQYTQVLLTSNEFLYVR